MADELTSYLDASLNEHDDVRRGAEQWLYQAAEEPGFVPMVLGILTDGEASEEAQHAGAIFLKNVVNRSWKDRDLPHQYLIPEEDKLEARARMFECMLAAPDYIRRQLQLVVWRMFEEGWPEAFPDVKGNILEGLQAVDDERKLSATLLIFYQLAKHHKFSKLHERVAYDEILIEALPHLYALTEMCLENPTPDSLLILTMVIKVYHVSAAYILPSFMIEPDTFRAWMQQFASIVAIEVDEPHDGDRDEWHRRPVWRAKKWTCKTLHKIFHRYGTRSHVTEEYVEFSDMYCEVYSITILELMWGEVQRFKSGAYVAPRVLTEAMKYLENALEPSHTWVVLKPLVPEILSDLIFPLLSFSEDDHELWTEDPPEYIRRKLDLSAAMDKVNTPDTEAAIFLGDLVGIRGKSMLNLIFEFAYAAITADEVAENPTIKDGGLFMIALVGDALIKSTAHNPHLEEMLVTHVFPEFSSEHGFLRARACQVFHNFSELIFDSFDNIVAALDAILVCLEDEELVVRVQAAIALRCLLMYQPVAAKAAEPHVTKIVEILLSLLHEAESDDLACVLDKLVELFEDELIPHSAQLLQSLIDQFAAFLDNDLTDDDVMHLALAAHSTLVTIMSLVRLAGSESQRDGGSKLLPAFEEQLQPLLLNVFNEGIIDYAEDFCGMVVEFVDGSVSEGMWEVFAAMHGAFRRDMVDFWEEFVPVIYNYIRYGVGQNNFPPEALDMMVDMCRTILEREDDGDAWRACKLMENIITWGESNVGDVVPALVGLAMSKLLDEGDDLGDVLMVGCVNVVLTALRQEPEMVVECIDGASAEGDEPLLGKLFALWFSNRAAFVGYHNRKLGVLVLTTLLQLPYGELPSYIQQVWPHILDMALFFFDQFEYAEQMRLEEDETDDEDEDGDEGAAAAAAGDEEEEIGDDEDYIDDDAEIADLANETLYELARDAASAFNEERDCGEHADYTTRWDIFEYDAWGPFAEVVQDLEARNPESAAAAFSELSEDDQTNLGHVCDRAAERADKAARGDS